MQDKKVIQCTTKPNAIYFGISVEIKSAKQKEYKTNA